MASNTERDKILFSVLRYLKSIRDENAEGLDIESFDVALQCLREAFKIDPENEAQKAELDVPATLPEIFKYGLACSAAVSSNSPLGSIIKNALHTVSNTPVEKSDEDIFEEKFQKYLASLREKGYFNNVEQDSEEYNLRVSKARARLEAEEKEQSAARLAQAEEKKQLGNELLQQKKIDEAIQAYNEAITLNPKSAIYYANRAAAYSQLKRHDKAIEDCHSALRCDNNYSKAYSRLGLAHFSLGEYQQAVAAYKRAAELEPENDSVKQSLIIAEKKFAEKGGSSPAHGHSHGGVPCHGHNHGAGGHGHSHGAPGAPPAGMPEGLAGLMNNPAVQGLVNKFQETAAAGGGVPSMQDFVSNPALMSEATSLLQNPELANIFANPAIMNMAANVMQNPDMLGSLLGGFMGGKKQ